MRVVTLIMAAGAASATEIRFYNGEDCSGSYVACSDIDSATCCVPGAFNATRAGFLNTPVRAIMIAFQKNDSLPACSPNSNQSGAADDAGRFNCLGETPVIGSARWKEYYGGKACADTKMVDTLVFDATTQYNLNGMDEGTQKQLLGIAENGMTGRDILAEFEGFKIEEREL